MNKILRYSFVALLAMIGMGNAFAEKVVFDFTTYGLENAEDVTTRDFRSEGDKIVIIFENGTNEKNGPKYYNTGTAIRCYGGNAITVKLNLTTEVVTKVEFTYGSGEGTNEMTVLGDTDESSFDGTTWTGRAGGSMKVEIGGTSGHRRIQKIAFTLTPKDAETWTVAGTLPLVNKSWKNDTPAQRGEYLLVQLYCDGEAVGDPIKLTEDDDWSYVWVDLEGGHDYTVDEPEVPEGYVKTVDKPVVGGTESGEVLITCNMTNEKTEAPKTFDGTTTMLIVGASMLWRTKMVLASGL